MAWVSLNFGSLFGGKRKKDILTLTAEAAKNATYRAKTDLKIDHLTDAIGNLGDRIEKRLDGLHSCIDKAQREAKESTKEHRAELKVELQRINDKIEKRDDYLEKRINECRDEKRPG